jgi:hypothetical protein
MYEGIFIRLTADFSGETVQVRREWNETFSSERKKRGGGAI